MVRSIIRIGTYQDGQKQCVDVLIHHSFLDKMGRWLGRQDKLHLSCNKLCQHQHPSNNLPKQGKERVGEEANSNLSR